MNVEAVLKQKRIRKTKRQFSYEIPDQEMTDALRKMEVSFFNVVVDVSIVSFHAWTSFLVSAGRWWQHLFSGMPYQMWRVHSHCALALPPVFE